MAGYSGTPLPKKLGIKPEHRVVALAAPKGFLPEVKYRARLTKADVLIAFVKERSALADGFKQWAKSIEKNGGLWVAWPKKASKIETDVTETVVREVGLASGLVDNKVCAIDEVWSGLRFVYRVEDR